MVEINTELTNNNAPVVITRNEEIKPTLSNSEILYSAIVIPKTSLPVASSINKTSAINKDASIDTSEITTDDYTLIGSLQISNSEAKTLSASVSKVASGGYEVLGFADKWTASTEKFNEKSPIKTVSIEDLYTSSENIIYNSKTKEVSFKDPTMVKTDSGGCVIPGSDTVTLGKLTSDIALIQLVDKINTFGKVYDFQFKNVNYGQYKAANTSVCSSVANALGYVSFDKLLNDEIVRKRKIDALFAEDNVKNPPYSGFLVSKDYLSNGWINIDQLAVDANGIVDESLALSIRTKKLVDAKRILVKMLINFSSSIIELNSQNKLVDFGVRVKNMVTGQVFDFQDVKNGNLGCVGNQITLSYGGKLDYGNTETNTVPELICDPCEKIIQDPCTKSIVKLTNCVAGESVGGISHEIMPQIRINPLIGIRETAPDFVNTIDPIQWTTGIQNVPDYKLVFEDLIAEWGENEYVVGHLNVPRSFHYGSGDASNAFVCGGFFNSILKENTSSSIPNAFNNVKAWNLIGKSEVYYEIATPGGYDYNTVNSFVLHYEENWDGNHWFIKNNAAIPVPKAMGLAGGGRANEEKLVGFGACDATFLNNGVIKSLLPTSQLWTTVNNDAWVHLNNANYARVSPAGYLKSTTITSSGSTVSGLDCSSTPVIPNNFFYVDTNADSLGSEPLRIDASTQLKLQAAMKAIMNDTSNSINTSVSTNLGIVFNGWVGGGNNSLISGIGTNGSNINPFGLDKILNKELTNVFEYMQEAKVDFSASTPSLNPNPPSVISTVVSTVGWFVDTSRNYPIRTMGTLYLGNECRGVATGGKTGVSLSEQDSVNAITNIKYSYFNDSKYSEFNNSVVNLAYEFNGVGWVRRDNLLEGVAFHSGVGDADHQIIYGGIHGTVERSDISVSYPGCDEWESMIRSFGGTWHRKGTTGLDREKRYASFNTIHIDAHNNTYYKAGDSRDKNGDAISYDSTFLEAGNVPELCGANWPSYVDSISGHITEITYANKNSKFPSQYDITRFVGGESWVSKATKYENLFVKNPILPYAEREGALDDVDQVGATTKNYLTFNSFMYPDTYKPDFMANPLASADGISAFPAPGYFASKDNNKNIVDQYKYAGHPTDGGMWLWSRPTAGEELFHPSNIHDKPQYYFDSCGVKHISGTWQTYENWIDQSFNTNIGLHSAVCWYFKHDCLSLQSTDIEKQATYSFDTATARNYRWTMGDFRVKANRLSPGGKEIGCLDMNMISDMQLVNSVVGINIPILGVAFISGGPTETGSLNPIIADYTSNFFTGTALISAYPVYTVNPSADFVGYDSRSLSPIDYFNRAWYIPTIPKYTYVVDSTVPHVTGYDGIASAMFTYSHFDISGNSIPISGYIFDGTTYMVTANPYNLPIDFSCCLTCNVSGSNFGQPAYEDVVYDENNNIWYTRTIYDVGNIPLSAAVYNCDVIPTSGGLDVYYGGHTNNRKDGSPYFFTCDAVAVNETTVFRFGSDNVFSGYNTSTTASQVIFYNDGWFVNTVKGITGCDLSDGFYRLEKEEPLDLTCGTFWSSGSHTTHPPMHDALGFYWKNNSDVAHLGKKYGFYQNSFPITQCDYTPYISLRDSKLYWNFELPKSEDETRLANLREFYDLLSFGLPETYVRPTKFTYSFYVTRDGVGLDQLFYGAKKNIFVERWKFPHTDTVLDMFQFNKKDPHTILNDGSGTYAPLSGSNLFKYGTLSTTEFEYPKIYSAINGTVDGNQFADSMLYMSSVQADISSSRVANYFNAPTSGSANVKCDFTSLRTWFNTPVPTQVLDRYYTNYYPMSYDNFNGPSGSSYFLPRGRTHQSQFSIIPSANSSAIRDRASLWPWCDLLEGKSTNKPTVGHATWYWDNNGNLWTAEVLNKEVITPKFCYDQRINVDPLHRKLSSSTIAEMYPSTFERETYRIKCQDRRGEYIVNYKIVYDEVAGPELVGNKAGFDYNIFGTALKPRTIDLSKYNNKPLSGPTQEWVQVYDEEDSIHAVNWRRTQINGVSGVPEDLYRYKHGTICEMISGGYNRNNIKNGVGYFCRLESQKDIWIYSAPMGETGLNVKNSNFFIQESPFAISKVLEGSSIGMQEVTGDNVTSANCIINGFPLLTATCYSVSSAPSGCCYVPGVSGECLSYDIEHAKFAFDPSVCRVYVTTPINIALTTDPSGAMVPCVSAGLLDPSVVPLSAIGFFSYGEIPPIDYVAPYTAIGWEKCNNNINSYGSEIVRSIKYSNGVTDGGFLSNAYITGPKSFGIGGLGLGKSNGLCNSLLYSGDRTGCQYSQMSVDVKESIPSDETISKAWPWNVLGFDGLLGPTGFTDAIDDQGNYWMAIGDSGNTNPYVDTNFSSFGNNPFKNHYTIIMVNKLKKFEFFKTVLARTNWKEVDSNNLSAILCLSQSFDLVKEDIRGSRYREGILEALNMIEGQRYFDLYVKIIQENKSNVYESPVIANKVSYVPTTFINNALVEQLSGSFILPTEPLAASPKVEVIQMLNVISQFDINCLSCFTCDETFLTSSPSASNWTQHNHEEWIAPYLESPFAGPYSNQGFNIWLNAGGEPRWGVSLWSNLRDGKVWANYRRHSLHVNEYRNHVILSVMTAAVAIDDFASMSTSTANLTGSTAHVPVYVNYDEFIYCLEDYADAKLVKDLLAVQNAKSKNGVDCTDHLVASVNGYTLATSGSEFNTNSITCTPITDPCSGFNLVALKNTNEGYVEWVTSFIQEYRSPETFNSYYFKYNNNSKMESNTYMDGLCINSNDITPYQWRRYQDGVGLGGDAPSFNLFDDNTEFTCKRLNHWFIGQTAIGSPDKSIVVGGYGIIGDGELHRSNSWWESATFGVTFKWNKDVIQPEDGTNMNYKHRTLSPFWSNGENAGANCTLGVTLFDVSDNTKVQRQGIAKFEEDSLEYNVVFSEPIPDYLPNNDKYCISLLCSDNVKAWWENKTATGFTIRIETKFSGFIDWSIYLEDAIPSEQIDGLDEQETFEKFDEL